MATLWHCLHSVRLRHTFAYNIYSASRSASKSTFSKAQHLIAPVNSSDHASIWQKRSKFLVEGPRSKAFAKVLSDEYRLDLILLRAAIWHDFHSCPPRQLFKHKQDTDQIIKRVIDLYEEMASNQIHVDNRWCNVLIHTLSNIVKQRGNNGESMSYAEISDYLNLARKMFLQISSDLSHLTFINTSLVHGLVNLEMQAAATLRHECDNSSSIDQKSISEHLQWVTDLANMMANKRAKALQEERFDSPNEETYRQDLINLSSTKADITIINLYILRGDLARAVEALRGLLKHAADLTNDKNTKRKAASQHLRRVAQNYTLARSAMINVLVGLCNKVRTEGRNFRFLITEVIQLAQKSVEDGVWDVVLGDDRSRSKLRGQNRQGPSYDLARLCSRAVSAVSPATTKKRRAVDGVKFEMIDGDEWQHCEDFFALLKIIIDLRSSAVAREIVQTLRQTVHDQPLSSLEPIAQPWRKSFRTIFDFNREMSARIIWCSFSPWSRKEKRISKKEQETNQEAQKRAQKETDLFLKRLTFILNDFMIPFGMSEASWQAAATAIRNILHLVPSPTGREHAKVLFEQAYERARKGNFGAIPPK